MNAGTVYMNCTPVLIAPSKTFSGFGTVGGDAGGKTHSTHPQPT